MSFVKSTILEWVCLLNCSRTPEMSKYRRCHLFLKFWVRHFSLCFLLPNLMNSRTSQAFTGSVGVFTDIWGYLLSKRTGRSVEGCVWMRSLRFRSLVCIWWCLSSGPAEEGHKHKRLHEEEKLSPLSWEALLFSFSVQKRLAWALGGLSVFLLTLVKQSVFLQMFTGTLDMVWVV